MMRLILVFALALFGAVAHAEKPIMPSQLSAITNAQLAVGDLMIVYDLTAGFTKKITLDELDTRWGGGGGGGEGDVEGPAESVNNELVLFSGTTGKVIKRTSGTGLCKVTSGVASFASLLDADVSASAAIAYSKLALSASILNADISGSAAIAYSKLNLAASLVNADISGSAAIAYSKLNLTGGIVNADVNASAAIAYSKLSLADSVLNADINSAAAIARSKIASGTNDHVVINSGAGALSSEATLAKSRGGAGADMSSVTFPSSGVIATTASNVATATALAANPADCGAGEFANAINASGTLTCATPSGGTIGGSTGSTDRAILLASGTGGATIQAAPSGVSISTDGVLTSTGGVVGTLGLSGSTVSTWTLPSGTTANSLGTHIPTLKPITFGGVTNQAIYHDTGAGANVTLLSYNSNGGLWVIKNKAYAANADYHTVFDDAYLGINKTVRYFAGNNLLDFGRVSGASGTVAAPKNYYAGTSYLAPRGSVSAAGFSFYNNASDFTDIDANTGIYSSAADNVDITTAGSNRMNVDSSGKITLGTASGTQIHRINGSTVSAGSDAMTLLNGPANTAGNPDTFLKININGTDYVIPAWTP